MSTKRKLPDTAEELIRELVENAVRVTFADDPPVGKNGEPVFDDTDAALARCSLNDLGNSARLLRRFGQDMMWIAEIGWIAWTGTHWSAEEGESKARLMAHNTARLMRREYLAMVHAGPRANDDKPETLEAFDKRCGRFIKFVIEAGNSGKLTAMLDESKPVLARLPDALDQQLWKVTLQNATIDLKPAGKTPARGDDDDDGAAETVAVRRARHARADLISRLMPLTYDPKAECPHWQAFLDGAVPDAAIQNFLQRFLGYCLTGTTSEQIIVMLWGQGSNGKSTLMDTISHIMGNYAVGLPISSLMAGDKRSGGGGQATPDLARLRSCRYVTTSEPETGERFSETMIKQLTGDERLTVRHLNKDFFEFYPQFKVVVSFNNKPNVRGIDEGFWRRIILVPFEQKFVDAAELAAHPGALPKIKGLGDTLKGEASGIFNWMLDGYRMWRESGLEIPDSIKAATAAYRAEINPIGQFVEDCVERAEGYTVSAAVMFRAYEIWCEGTAIDPHTHTKFGRRLADMGFEKWKNGVYYYQNVQLKNDITRLLEEDSRRGQASQWKD